MIRTILFYIRFALHLLTTIPTSFHYWRLGRAGQFAKQQEYLYAAVKDWGHYLVETTGSQVEVVGLEHIPEGACLIISNHQSNFDIPILGGYLNKPVGFIAKKELGKVPIISTWMKRIHCIFIDRENSRQAVKALSEAIASLKAGNSLIIFPEGTRSKGDQMGVFKKGSLRIAEKSGVPIVPITIDGSHRILEGNNNRIRPAKVRVIIDEPIYMERLDDEQKAILLDTIKAQIQKNLDQSPLKQGSL